MKNIYKLIIFIFMGFILCICPAMADSAIPNIIISPKIIEIGTFFSGGDITISGEIPMNDDIVIEVSGHDSKNEFDIKGKKGILWMTIGQVHIDRVPELYILLLPPGENWGEKIESLGVGMGQLKSRMQAESSIAVPPDIFNMFIKFKESESLYGEKLKAIKYLPMDNGKKKFTIICKLPSSIKKGKYTIKATTISKNIVKTSITKNFSVEEVGFIKLVDHLASDRRILYGVSAVVIALIAGLGMGIVFKQSGGSH
jgi:hypothetical protein